MGRCCQTAKVQRDTAHIVFSIYISVIVSRHVPLPVCSGVGLCALSLWLKPYPCNRPLRVGLTCGRSRFRLCSALPVCCRSGEMPVHHQHNRIPTGMFDTFFPFPAFGKKGIVIWRQALIAFLSWMLPFSSNYKFLHRIKLNTHHWTMLFLSPFPCRVWWPLFMTEH